MRTVSRQFIRYTVPTIIAMMINGLYEVIDGIFIGRILGADGLAGINAIWPLLSIVLGIGLLIGVGAGSLVSVYQGVGNAKKARQVISSGLLLILLLFPVIVIAMLYSDILLQWQQLDAKVFEYAQDYLMALRYGVLFVLGSMALPFLLRNDRSPNLATFLMIIGAIINVIFDYYFINVLSMGLAGAAWATIIAQGVITIIGTGYFFSGYANLRLHFSDLKIKISLIYKIFIIGLSSFFMYVYAGLMVMLHNRLFMEYGNSIHLAAYSIVGYLFTFYYLFAEGIANGMQPLTSYNYGAKRLRQLFAGLRLGVFSEMLSAIIFLGVINLIPSIIVEIFNNNDEQLIKESALGIRLHLLGLPFEGYIIVVAAYFQSINKGGKALWVSMLNITIQIPFLFSLPVVLGVNGIWLANPVSNFVLSIIVTIMLLLNMQEMKLNYFRRLRMRN